MEMASLLEYPMIGCRATVHNSKGHCAQAMQEQQRRHGSDTTTVSLSQAKAGLHAPPDIFLRGTEFFLRGIGLCK
jgi:hypothetical protein